MVRAVGIGLTVAVAWTLLCAFLLAKLIDRELVDMESVGYFSMGILLVGGFVAGKITGSGLGKRSAVVILYSGCACFCFLILCNFLFFGGDFRGIGVCAVLIFLGGFLNMLPLGKNGGGKRKVRYKKPR